MINYDVIVAGLGAMGSAALDQLGARGLRVLGIEPHGIPHGLGSSGGDTRLIRKAYFEHPDYVPLLERAYQGWRALEADAGETLLHVTGSLYIGQPDSELIAGARRSAAQHELALEDVSEARLARGFPQFRVPAAYVALLEPEAGFVLAERGIRAQVERAISRGAEIAAERLVRWRATADGVEVVTDRGRYGAGGLVITVGSWSDPLLADLGVSLRVTRQPLFWLQPRDREAFVLGKLPCWAVQRADAPGLFYGFPALPLRLTSQLGAKAGHHAQGEEVDPDAPRRAAGREELEALLAAVRDFLPGLVGPLTGSRVCLYTNTIDGHFIVDRHPAHDHVVFGCGFSGHGFKFAPVIGEALADLVLQGHSPLPVAFLRRR